MANVVEFFMAPEDEVAFFRFLERMVLEVYPRRVPPDWTTFRANAEAIPNLPEEDLYLVATEIGAAIVDKVKRGKEKGFWRIDEVRSPVIFMERSRKNEEGELLSGKLWAELDVTPQTGRRTQSPDRFRRMFMEIEDFFKKSFRGGDPKDYYIGPRAAREFKEGLVLRVNEHRGGTVRVHK